MSRNSMNHLSHSRVQLVKSVHPLHLTPDPEAKAFRLAGPFDDSLRYAEPAGGGRR